MALRCFLVDDSTHFLEAASTLLEREGIAVVGVASTIGEALAGVHLSGESIRDFLADRNHGNGCRHEALVYSSADELVAATVPFLRQGVASGEDVLVVLREAGWTVLREALDVDAAQIEFADALAWYQSPEHAFQGYSRYLDERLERGAHRVRIVAEVVWPESSATVEVAEWKRYEAGISAAMASFPVSFICAYDTRRLPDEIITDAQRTHPVLRTAAGSRPSARYSEPATFVRGLELSVPALAQN